MHGMRLQQDGSVLHTDGQLTAGDYSLPGNVSSQFISGLLFALPLLSGNSTLTVTGALQSARYVAMTEQALRAVTLDAAYQYFEEREKGSITPGKRADFVLLDGNPLTVAPVDFRSLSVTGTILRGEMVNQA